MQTRVILLFALFVVMAVFYASVTKDGASTIATKLQVQTEMFNQLNEQGSNGQDGASTSSGNWTLMLFVLSARDGK